ncbi:Putative large exoprotein involved in heme utilization or adhesion of ShlA/HecA/FhaA family [Serratia rubidaea]|nr:Putative large exoprotein involved in heme utilization or adhesion of ShlA/HecA/FhaA family [Serratia rubidaea]
MSASRDKLHSNYDSVQEQTGIFAGKGGFDVKVGEHTQLDGAVIGSTATADKNRLETGTLGWSDIHNKADFKAEHSGGSLSTGGPVGKDLLTNMAGGMLPGANNSGHAEGTSKAAVSEGTIAIREQDKQQQDVAELSRDTENANGSIGPIFDKEKEQNRLREAQLIGEIGGMAMDVISTQGDLIGLKAAKAKHPGWSADKLRETKEYQTAMKEYGTGSDLHKAAQALTGALTALAGNNLAGALASGASPYLATEIKKLTTNQQTGEVNVAANAMAHAVLGAVTAQLNNQSAVAGGLGAGGGELTARYIAGQLFPGKKVSELSENERQQVSALSQLAAGLAGGLATGDTAGGVTAAQTGKNAVENNLLGKVLVEGCAIAAPCRSKVAEQLIEIGVKAGIAGVTGAAIKDVADKMTSDELDHLVTLKMMGNDEITGKYLSSLQDKYAPSHTGGNQIINPGPNNTGGDQTATGNVPAHTGNNQASGQGAINTGNTEGVPDTGGNTTVTPIPEGPNKDDLAYLALKGKEAQEAAKNLGFDRRIPPQKAPFNSHGQPVYFDGKTYITPDVDSHNVTNGWKMFDRRGERMGTYDSDLNRIKD